MASVIGAKYKRHKNIASNIMKENMNLEDLSQEESCEWN